MVNPKYYHKHWCIAKYSDDAKADLFTHGL